MCKARAWFLRWIVNIGQFWRSRKELKRDYFYSFGPIWLCYQASPSWILGQYKTTPITADRFNPLSTTKRVALMRNTLVYFQLLIELNENSFRAHSGPDHWLRIKKGQLVIRAAKLSDGIFMLISANSDIFMLIKWFCRRVIYERPAMLPHLYILHNTRQQHLLSRVSLSIGRLVSPSLDTTWALWEEQHGPQDSPESSREHVTTKAWAQITLLWRAPHHTA